MQIAQAARRLRQSHRHLVPGTQGAGLPEGLRLLTISTSLSANAAAQLLKLLAKRTLLEVGLSYRQALARQEVIAAPHTLHGLPAVAAAVKEATTAFGHAAGSVDDKTFSLIARHYRAGAPGLKHHRDAMQLFQEPVYGLVLRGGEGAPRC